MEQLLGVKLFHLIRSFFVAISIILISSSFKRGGGSSRQFHQAFAFHPSSSSSILSSSPSSSFFSSRSRRRRREEGLGGVFVRCYHRTSSLFLNTRSCVGTTTTTTTKQNCFNKPRQQRKINNFSSSTTFLLSSAASDEDMARWEHMYNNGREGEEAALQQGNVIEDFTTTRSEVRVITFDLDNTLWKTGACISAANDALADFLTSQSIIQQSRVEVVMGNLFQAEKIRYAPFDGENAKSPVLLTQLRTDAIQYILENDNNYDPVTAEAFAKQAFRVWTEARHAAASTNFADSVIECLNNVSSSIKTSRGEKVLVGAITDGNSNPDLVAGLTGKFEFCINAEMVGVSKPDKRVYLEAARYVFDHPSFQDIVGVMGGSLETEDEIENAIGPYWVHIGDDFMKDVVAAKGLKMRTIWATELIRDKLKAKNKNNNIQKEEVATTEKTKDVKEFVQQMAERKTVSMAVGDDFYLADSMREEFVDAIAEEFRSLSDILLKWHNEGCFSTSSSYSQPSTPSVNGGGTTGETTTSAEPNGDIVTVVLPDKVSDTTNGASSSAAPRAFRLVREDCTMDVPAPVQNRETRTMQDIMTLAQMDKSSGVFAFPLSDIEAFQAGKRVIMIKIGDTDLELSKDIFASMTVQEVLNFTNENPVTISLYMKDASDAPSFDIF